MPTPILMWQGCSPGWLDHSVASNPAAALEQRLQTYARRARMLHPQSLIRLLLVTVYCLVVGHPQLATCEDWSQFRGPHFGATSEVGVPVKWNADSVVWKTPIQGRGASSPVTFGDRIYLTCYTGYGIDRKAPGEPSELERHLLCLSLKDGTVIWTKTIPTTSPKNPFTPWAVALHGYASSTPAVDKTGVYVFFGATGFFAFDHDGTQLWKTPCGTKTHMFGAGNSPVLYDNLVIINASVECGDLIALNKKNGKQVWRQSGMARSWNTPAIYETADGKTELAVSIEGKILAFDPVKGTPRWSCSGIPDYICPSIIAHDGVVFASGGRRSKMIAVRTGGEGDVTNTRRAWEIAKGSNVSSPVYHDGHIYWAKEKGGIVYCANAKTGELRYEERLKPSPGLIYASPLLAGGRLYYVSREKGIYVLPAKPKFELLAHTTMKGDNGIFNASPVPIADGKVLVRSDKFLYCIGP